jgi:hypothetical protein
MPKYMVIQRNAHLVMADGGRQARQRVLQIQESYGVVYEQTWYSATDRTLICVCLAPSKTILAAAHQDAYGYAADEIMEVVDDPFISDGNGMAGEVYNTDYTDTDFTAYFIGGSYIACSFMRTNLTYARLNGQFIRCDFTGSIFEETILDGSFIDCIGLPQTAQGLLERTVSE